MSEPLLKGNTRGMERKASSGGKKANSQLAFGPKSTIAVESDIRKRKSVLNRRDFIKRDSVKQRVQSALLEDEFNVEDLYSNTGLWQALARQDSWFSTASLLIVAANVIWIGIDEDINHADVLCDAPILSQVVNNVFCTWFLFETLVHFLAFKNKKDAFSQGKFVFDFLLTLSMIWETWIEVFLYLVLGLKNNSSAGSVSQLFRLFRLFRLTRIPRIVRLCIYVPEMLIMIKGMATAMRSVMVILVFLLVTIFIFGIVFTELLKETDGFKDSFGSVHGSMYTLLSQVLCGVDSDFLDSLLDASVLSYLIYLAFLFMATFTLMNMLIGVLCDVVSNVREAELDNIHVQHLDHEITKIVEYIDSDHNGFVTKQEWEKVFYNKETLRLLDAIGVDLPSFGGLQEFIFKDTDSLTNTEFCHLIAQFRGCRSVTVKDLLDTQKFICLEVETVIHMVKDMFERKLAAHSALAVSPWHA